MSDKTLIHIAAVNTNKIAGIRAIREIADIDLRTAKEIVERFFRDEEIIQVVGITSCHISTHTLTLDLDQVVKGCEID